MPSVRILPHFLPRMRAWHPVRIRIIVGESAKPLESVRVKIEGCQARFCVPWGADERLLECRPNVIRIGNRVALAHVAFVTIWPMHSGTAKLILSSPEKRFIQAEISTREQNSAPASTSRSLDMTTSLALSYEIPHPVRFARALQGVIMRKVTVLLTIVVAIGVSLPLGEYLYDFYVAASENAAAPAKQGVTPAPTRHHHVPEPEAVVKVVAVDPEPQPVAESTGRPEPLPKPASTPVEPEPQPKPASTPLEPTGCGFVNGNRPRVEDGKYVLECDQGPFLGTATYEGGGRFRFADFEPIPSSP